MAETCPIGTRERLEALLGGQLPDAERAQLKAHLEHPCETCLELLEAMDEDDLFEAAAGPQAEMSAAEAERMFEAVAPPAKQERAPGLLQRIASWMRAPVLVPLAAAAVLVIAFGLSSMVTDETASSQAAYTGVKSIEVATPLPTPVLAGFVGSVQNGTPRVTRRLIGNEHIASGELVLLRYTLARPAYLYLLAEADGTATLLHASDSPQPAGEHELGAQGQALAVDPSQLGAEVRLVLVASPQRIASSEQAALLDADRRATSCPHCSTASLQVRSEPSR